MSYTIDQDKKFKELDHLLKPESFGLIKKAANGGTSILFTYPPEEETLYLNKATEEFSEKCEFINIADLFVKFIEQDGWTDFKEYYESFRTTPHLIFKSADGSNDFYSIIIDAIKRAAKSNKVPVLIRTGALYKTGIENNNIIENRSVMQLKLPLVIFYPSTIKNGDLMFLNFKHASKYRCTIIE